MSLWDKFTAMDLLSQLGVVSLVFMGLKLSRVVIAFLGFVFMMPPPKVVVPLEPYEEEDTLDACQIDLDSFKEAFTKKKVVKLFDPSTYQVCFICVKYVVVHYNTLHYNTIECDIVSISISM